MLVIAATDINKDVGSIIEESKCGYWTESGNLDKIKEIILKTISSEENFIVMKENAWKLLQTQYIVDKTYQLINEKFSIQK